MTTPTGPGAVHASQSPELANVDRGVTIRSAVMALRSRLTPYDALAAELPAEGRIVDLGCGWGFLSLALCRASRARQVIGIDHDAERVHLATRSAQGFPADYRPVFQVGDVRQYLESIPAGSVEGISMIDILHYFDDAAQQGLINNAARALRPGGVLLARDIDARDGVRALINKFYERLATGVGFTKSASSSLLFRGRREWTQMFEAARFSVRAEHSGPRLLADVLFVGVKNL